MRTGRGRSHSDAWPVHDGAPVLHLATMRRSAPRLAVLYGACAALAGCRGCRNEHPYVPYRIEGGAASTLAVSVETGPPPAEAGPFVRELATAAPANATSWTLGSAVIAAPQGTTFRLGLVWDIDGDAHDDLLTLVEELGQHDEPAREGLYFYRGGASGTSPPLRVAIGNASSVGPGCTRIERLARVGKRSAAVEVGQSCPAPSPRAAVMQPDRDIAVLSWADGALRPRLALPIVDPPDAPSLSFDVEATDVDGDGLDDITLRVSLVGGGPPFEPRPAVHATFRWFDRPAGMSRQPDEPEASLHTIAAGATARATKAKDAAASLALADAGKALFQAVCEESSGRRVAPPPSPHPLACNAGRSLEDLGLAATRAYVTMGDALDAIAALDAAQLPPASRTAARTAEATAWVTQLAPVVQAVSVRAIGAVPLLGSIGIGHDGSVADPPAGVSWSALRFEPSGSLLVRTPSGVVRVEPVQGDEAEAAGMVAWGSSVVSPDGTVRLLEATSPCRGVVLEARFGAGAGGSEWRLELPIAASLASPCSGGHGEPAPVFPVAWGASGLEADVAGQPLLFSSDGKRATPLVQWLGQPVTLGAPRSPDGKTVVVPTTLGIVVRGEKSRIFRAKELDHGYSELRDCVVSDDGARVACVRGGRAFVGVWPQP